jgi:hypothetical protein
MQQNIENDAQYQCELCNWTPATLHNHCFNMLWRTKQKRVENTHVQNNGCLRLGVVRTDIDDNIHQDMHQYSEKVAQYQCELCHRTPATLNNHCFNMLWPTKQKRVENTHGARPGPPRRGAFSRRMVRSSSRRLRLRNSKSRTRLASLIVASCAAGTQWAPTTMTCVSVSWWGWYTSCGCGLRIPVWMGLPDVSYWRTSLMARGQSAAASSPTIIHWLSYALLRSCLG